MEFSALKSNFVSAFLCWSSRAHTHTHSSKRVYSLSTKIHEFLVSWGTCACVNMNSYTHKNVCLHVCAREHSNMYTCTHTFGTRNTRMQHNFSFNLIQVEEFFLLDRLVFKMASLRPTVGAFAITGAILCDIVVKYMDTIKSRTGMLSAITGHLFFSTAWQWSDTPSMPAYLIYPTDFTQKVHVITTRTSMHSLSLPHWFLLFQNGGIFFVCLSFVCVVSFD